MSQRAIGVWMSDEEWAAVKAEAGSRGVAAVTREMWLDRLGMDPAARVSRPRGRPKSSGVQRPLRDVLMELLGGVGTEVGTPKTLDELEVEVAALPMPWPYERSGVLRALRRLQTDKIVKWALVEGRKEWYVVAGKDGCPKPGHGVTFAEPFPPGHPHRGKLRCVSISHHPPREKGPTTVIGTAAGFNVGPTQVAR